MDLVGNDVDTLHEEKNHLVGFSFIRVYRSAHMPHKQITMQITMRVSEPILGETKMTWLEVYLPGRRFSQEISVVMQAHLMQDLRWHMGVLGMSVGIRRDRTSQIEACRKNLNHKLVLTISTVINVLLYFYYV